jgi:hypothetical protein
MGQLEIQITIDDPKAYTRPVDDDSIGQELLGPNALARTGWSRNSMTIGDVVVEGSPARDGTRLGSARFITLSATGRRILDVSGGGNR